MSCNTLEKSITKRALLEAALAGSNEQQLLGCADGALNSGPHRAVLFTEIKVAGVSSCRRDTASQPLYLKSPPKRGCDRLQRGLHDDIAGARARPEQLQARQTPDPAEGRPSTLIPEGVPHGFHVRTHSVRSGAYLGASPPRGAPFFQTLSGRPRLPASARPRLRPRKTPGPVDGRLPPPIASRGPLFAPSISASAFKASRRPIRLATRCHIAKAPAKQTLL